MRRWLLWLLLLPRLRPVLGTRSLCAFSVQSDFVRGKGERPSCTHETAAAAAAGKTWGESGCFDCFLLPPPQLLSNRIHREGWSIVGVTHVFLSKAFGCVVVPPGGQSAPQKGALQGGSGDGAGGAGRSPRTYSTSFLEGT